MSAIGNVRVTMTTEVVDTSGQVMSSVTEVVEQPCGNPLHVTRVAHRVAQELADRTRVMLQPRYGEIDPEWKRS